MFTRLSITNVYMYSTCMHVACMCLYTCTCAILSQMYNVCTRTHSHTQHAHTLAHTTCTHSHTHTHTPILQVWLLQLGRETLAISPRCAAGIDLVLLKIFEEFEAGKVVVKIDMMILSLQICGVFTTLAPNPCSVVLLFFPVQTSNLEK